MTRVPTFPRSARKLPGALAALVVLAGTAGWSPSMRTVRKSPKL